MSNYKFIKSYEGRYSVNKTGDIYSHFNNKILKQSIDSRGYSKLILSLSNIKKTVLVHRIVAEAFIENNNNYLEVNHLDGNKQNNSVSNLEWCSHAQNQIHAFKLGLRRGIKGEKHHNSKLTEKDINLIKDLKSKGISNLELSNKFKVNKGHISRIVNKRSWRHL